MPAAVAPFKLMALRVPWWRKLVSASGPGYLIAVGYMDPGNWATDLAGGSHFGYMLLVVVALASGAAMVLQHLAIKLGVVTGMNLAEVCREAWPRPVVIGLWLASEVMIIACDLAEVIGTAIGLGLLFGLPLVPSLIVTALDVVVLLALNRRGMRQLEVFVIVLIGTVVATLGVEVWLAQPQWGAVLMGLVPSPRIISQHDALYLSIGIIGATIMPHNLFLHSELVKGTAGRDGMSPREVIRWRTVDSTLALGIAAVVNGAILIVAAASFWTHGMTDVVDLGQAAGLLAPALGVTAAGTLFAVALLASGQNSTITATLAGQVVMEGFLQLRLSPGLRRVITRSLAIIPAVAVVIIGGAHTVTTLLVDSQIVLSLTLPLAALPLIWFTSRRRWMGALRNSRALSLGVTAITVVITGLNIWLLVGA
jgi:manganese transport protein